MSRSADAQVDGTTRSGEEYRLGSGKGTSLSGADVASETSQQETAGQHEQQPGAAIIAIAHDPRAGCTGAAVACGDDITLLCDTAECAQYYETTERVICDHPGARVVLPARGCGPAFVGAVQRLVRAQSGSLEMAFSRDFEPPPWDERGRLAAGALSALRRRVRPGLGVTAEAASRHVIIDRASLVALGIVDDEAHPNAHSGRAGRAPSVVSLFAEHARTAAGKRLVAHWLTHPLAVRADIVARLDAVERLRAGGIYKTVHASLKNVPPAGAVETFAETPRALKGIRSLIVAADGVKDLLDASATGALAACGHLVALMDRSIDWAASEERVCIKTGADAASDRARDEYERLPDVLSGAVSAVAARISAPDDTAVNVVYVPHVGFLVALRRGPDDEEVLQANGHLALVFATEHVLYCKEDETRALDASLGDVYARLADAELAVAHAIASEVAEHRDSLRSLMQALGTLDALSAFAAAADAYNLVKPCIVDEPVLRIADARHIAVEAHVGGVVPNSITLDEQARVAVLTGHNGAGKSVFVRTVGAAAAMAHAGAFVPAASAAIGVADRIATRMCTRESASAGAGAFRTDAAQVARMLALGTASSVLLVDEFGKGTVPLDGAALFAAAVGDLASRRDAPRTLAATHFHAAYDVLAGLAIRWLAMDDGGAQHRVVPGRPCGRSGAAACARRMGVPEDVCARAEALTSLFAADVSPAAMRYADVPAHVYAACEAVVSALLTGEIPDILAKCQALDALKHDG